MTVRRQSTGAADDKDILSRPIHLFNAGRWRAVSLDPERLPPSPVADEWSYEGVVPLGVRHVDMPGTEPEPVMTGLVARGYYVWQVSTDETAAL